MQLQRRTIAVIDGDMGIRTALERMLSIAGYRVLPYPNAETFLASPDFHEADCAVVDIHLGRMSGFDLALHPAVSAAKLPLIFVGTTDESARTRAIALGCIEYLRKPFMPIELLDAVFRATQDPPIP